MTQEEKEIQLNAKYASAERHMKNIERLHAKGFLTDKEHNKLSREKYWARKVKKDIETLKNIPTE